MTDRNPQHVLNEFLQAELHHTMGAYGFATRELERLFDQAQESERVVISDLDLEETLDSNRRLRDGHKEHGESDGGRRHPHPKREFDSSDDPEAPSLVRPQLANPVEELYATAITALGASLDAPPYDDQTAETPLIPGQPGEQLRELGLRLGVTQDPQRRIARQTQQDARLARERKLGRMQVRRDQAQKTLKPQNEGLLSPEQCVGRILGDCFEARPRRAQSTKSESGISLRERPLHQVVISALIDGHLRMHRAEHELSGPFERTFSKGGRPVDDIQDHLDVSIALHTFAYATARSMPWIFAINSDERDSVIAYYQGSCDSLTPPYCMWIARQVSLLALHRRGFSHWLRDDYGYAYKDFYKLRRQIRQIGRSLRGNLIAPPGARQFLDGLHAIAEHHTGRIYQAEHGHDVALRHFKQARNRLQRLEPDPLRPTERDPETRALLHNSRWRVKLLIGQGKAYWELGRVKSSVLCNVHAWRCFLQLSDTERHAESNLETVDEVIEWLELVADDPDIDKTELGERFAPLVAQFRTIPRSSHLRAIAADIMSRIGHALFLLRLPAGTEDPEGWDDTLAYSALATAAELDHRSTATGADLLNIKHRSPEIYRNHGDLPREAPTMAAIGEQWPGGGSEFEAAARVIEYLLQQWVDHPAVTNGAPDNGQCDDRPVEQILAEKLLPAFTTHTDSSNVKLAQVYRYLMQGPHGVRKDGVRLEFVCARRYSSFFPFLPRPSAFRVRGGGYFVRLIDAKLPELAGELGIPVGESRTAFGIVIDPGPDFLDNLYRCGYGLADIDMVVVTHDHADHIAELDALLALLHYRRTYGDERFRPPPPPEQDGDGTPRPCPASPLERAVLLPIVGNESVFKRYGFYNDSPEGGNNAVHVMRFEDLERLTAPDAEPASEEERCLLLPPSLRFTATTSIHHTDARGKLAQGCIIAVDDGSGETASIGFTSDTGGIDPKLYEPDVVVAHVSTVPLPDLRKLGQLAQAPAHVRADTAEFQRLWDKAIGRKQVGRSRHDPPDFLLRQLQFGFRSPPKRSLTQPLATSPLSPLEAIYASDEPKHLYLEGLVGLAKAIHERGNGGLLLVGEMREELGSFRSRIASELNDNLFRHRENDDPKAAALTADIGLALGIEPGGKVSILCSTCDLDNDMTDGERYHDPMRVYEVCVKGEHEGVFYNCRHHNPQTQAEPTFVELVERYDAFGH
jgi:hypothetical protein